MIPVSEALARVLEGVEPLARTERVALAEAGGRRLAAPVTAGRDQPPFDASAMDGYAVRAADVTPGYALRLVGESRAGRRFLGRIGPGETARVFTGAPMPPGADAVLIQENARRWASPRRCAPSRGWPRRPRRWPARGAAAWPRAPCRP